MRGRCDDDQFILQPGQDDDGGSMAGTLDQAEVGVKIPHGSDDIPRIADLQLQLCGGYALPKARQQPGQNVVADGRTGEQMQVDDRVMIGVEGGLEISSAVQYGE